MPQTVTQYDIVNVVWSPSSGTGAQLLVTAPDATTFTIATTSANAVPGGYSAWFSAEQDGQYALAWSVIGASETFDDTLTVTAFTPQTVMTIAQCYLSLNLPLTQMGGANAARDEDMLAYGQAALGVVEGIIGPVQPQLKVEIFDGGGTSVRLHYPPTSVLSVTENGVPIFDWVPDFTAAMVHAGTYLWNRPFFGGVQNVEVHYMAGSGNVPPNVMLAIREEFRFLWQLGRQGNFGGQINQESGPAAPAGFAIPNRVYELLANDGTDLPGFA